MVAAPNYIKNAQFSFRLTNKFGTMKSYATMSVELLNFVTECKPY